MFTTRGIVVSKLDGKVVGVVPCTVADLVEPPLLVAVTLITYDTPADRPLNTAGLDCVVGRVPVDGLMLYVYEVAPTPPVQPTVMELLVIELIVRAGWEGGSITEKLGPSVEPVILTAVTIIVWAPGVIGVNAAILLPCELHRAVVPSIVYLNDDAYWPLRGPVVGQLIANELGVAYKSAGPTGKGAGGSVVNTRGVESAEPPSSTADRVSV